MKRDLDLIREILFAIEASGPGEAEQAVDRLFEKFGKNEVLYHVALLREAGLVRVVTDDENKPVNMAGMNDPVQEVYFPQRLTWEGHEFVDAARDDTKWNKAKETLEKAGAWTVDIAKALLVSYLKQEIGL